MIVYVLSSLYRLTFSFLFFFIYIYRYFPSCHSLYREVYSSPSYMRDSSSLYLIFCVMLGDVHFRDFPFVFIYGFPLLPTYIKLIILCREVCVEKINIKRKTSLTAPKTVQEAFSLCVGNKTVKSSDFSIFSILFLTHTLWEE